MVIAAVIGAPVLAIIDILFATWPPISAGSTMTPMDRVDLLTFAVIVVACAWDFWSARRYPADEARRERLRTAGIVLWVLVLPAGVYLKRGASLGAWFLLMALLGGGGAFLFYWPYQRE